MTAEKEFFAVKIEIPVHNRYSIDVPDFCKGALGQPEEQNVDFNQQARLRNQNSYGGDLNNKVLSYSDSREKSFKAGIIKKEEILRKRINCSGKFNREYFIYTLREIII
jgi:hypothetical protein